MASCGENSPRCCNSYVFHVFLKYKDKVSKSPTEFLRLAFAVDTLMILCPPCGRLAKGQGILASVYYLCPNNPVCSALTDLAPGQLEPWELRDLPSKPVPNVTSYLADLVLSTWLLNSSSLVEPSLLGCSHLPVFTPPRWLCSCFTPLLLCPTGFPTSGAGNGSLWSL